MATPKRIADWFARFALRTNAMTDAQRRFLANAENRAFGTITEVMECCAENAVSAEVEVLVKANGLPKFGEMSDGKRHSVGWIDELGRLHSEMGTAEEARTLARVLRRDVPGLETMPRTIRNDVVALALWRKVKRGLDDRLHPVRIGTIEIGW